MYRKNVKRFSLDISDEGGKKIPVDVEYVIQEEADMRSSRVTWKDWLWVFLILGLGIVCSGLIIREARGAESSCCGKAPLLDNQGAIVVEARSNGGRPKTDGGGSVTLPSSLMTRVESYDDFDNEFWHPNMMPKPPEKKRGVIGKAIDWLFGSLSD
jgi:hypothetical protein